MVAFQKEAFITFKDEQKEWYYYLTKTISRVWRSAFVCVKTKSSDIKQNYRKF